MAGITNRGKLRLLEIALANTAQSGAIPSNYYVHLLLDRESPTAGTNTLGNVTQIADGNGYNTSGYTINRDTTDWDTQTEDDSTTIAYLQLKDVVWTAAGGTLPSAGSGARWAVLTNDDATLGDREVYFYWDLSSEREVSTGQTLTLQNCETRLSES
jgi:hypothetical protein